MRNYTLAALVVALALLAGCGTAASTEQAAPVKSQQGDPWGPGPEQTAEPDPEPSPDGKFSGSCDYVLGSDYTLIGDIEATNTGNVGIEVEVTIKWLQMGYDPITETKTLRVKPDQSKTARFNKKVDGTIIDRVQSYQVNHMGESLCKFDGVMIDTFGEPLS